ncbi:MAG: hypothetical protein ACR2L8_14130, partial [Solirubrobacteraceae bacterium]
SGDTSHIRPARRVRPGRAQRSALMRAIGSSRGGRLGRPQVADPHRAGVLHLVDQASHDD